MQHLNNAHCKCLIHSFLACTTRTTGALLDSSVPSVDISGADVVVHFCLSWRKLANARMISPQAFPGDTICESHCCQICLTSVAMLILLLRYQIRKNTVLKTEAITVNNQ